MPVVPLLSASEVQRVFEKFDWKYDRRESSHIMMIKKGHPATLSIPDEKEVARGTLRALIRAAGLTVEEFERARQRKGKR